MTGPVGDAVTRTRANRSCGSTAACVAAADARVSPIDHGLLIGDGVFETLRVYDGRPFAWDRHLDRLDHSAAGLGLPLPDRDELRAAADAVLGGERAPEARLRITVTGGRRAARDRARRGAAHGHRRGQRGACRARRPPSGGGRAVDPQRARRHRGTQDDLLRGERAGPRLRPRARRHRGGVRQHAATSCARPPAPTSSSCATGVVRTPPGVVGLPARRHPRARARAVPDAGHRRSRRSPLPDGRARATPTRRSSRPPSGGAGHPRRSTASHLADAPGPVTERLAAAFGALVATDRDP